MIFKVAQRVTQHLEYFGKKICHQELYQNLPFRSLWSWRLSLYLKVKLDRKQLKCTHGESEKVYAVHFVIPSELWIFLMGNLVESFQKHLHFARYLLAQI